LTRSGENQTLRQLTALIVLTLFLQTVNSVWGGAYTEEQAKRGAAVYALECLNCHGPDLAGADVTPALTGSIFTSNWNDLTIGDLSERIRITMPANNPGVLSRQQNADVIAYILKANNWPAGSTELPTQLAAMKAIKIEANAP
jgi:S-disulfanyl-L-cysteine oxidoreductase SoxD